MGQHMSAGEQPLSFESLGRPDFGVNSWFTAVLANSPSPRSGHVSAISEDSTCVWVYGGFWEDPQGQNKVCFQQLYRFHIPSLTWTLMPTTGEAPTTPCSQSALIVGQTLYMFGGTGVPFGQTNGHSMYMCDLKTLRWSVASNRLEDEPSPRFGQAMVNGKDGYLYLFGGTNFFAFTGDMYRFSLSTQKFERVLFSGDAPSPRYRHTMLQYRNNLLLFGGGSPFPTRDEVEMTFIYRFDMATHVWSQEPCRADDHFGFPLGRRSHTTVFLDPDTVLVMGGLLDTEETALDCWELNLREMQWLHRPAMSLWPSAAYFHTCEITGDGLLLTFGGVLADRSRTNQVGLFYTRIPRLTSLCCSAIAQQTNPTRDDCAAAGMPERFLRAIFPA